GRRTTMSKALSARPSAQRGCNLIEILILLAIIGLIEVAIGVAALGHLTRARQAHTLQEMRAVEWAVVRWQERGPGQCPPSLQALVRAGLLNRGPRDGWGRPLRLVRCDRAGLALYSVGPDGVAHTRDDVLSWAAQDRRWVQERPPAWP